jgi:hypothetical protein
MMSNGLKSDERLKNVTDEKAMKNRKREDRINSPVWEVDAEHLECSLS